MQLKKMTAFFSFLFVLLIASSYAEPNVGFRIHRSDYTFSTVFDMSYEQQPLGSIVKNAFHVATHYDLYNRFGLYEGQGVCRILCLGLLYSWGTEIDIYDVDPTKKVGMIDGQYATTEPAKFSFYDGNGERIAIAYLDKNCAGFTLLDPENSSLILGRLTRNFIVDTIDTWDIEIYFPERLPMPMMKIFAAFACDTQDKFKPDL